MLGAAAQAWAQAGITARGIAPSAKAASGMQDGAGIPSSTIHSWLWAVENGKEKLDNNTVIVMDEAGMTDTKIMAHVMHQIWDSGASCVLIGDAGQLQAVQQGGSFKAIDDLLDTRVCLTNIIRQEKKADRQAVTDMAEGRAGNALAHFQEAGQLAIATDSDAARGSLLADWMKTGLVHPKDQLIVTGTNLDAALLNREIQEERLRTGCLPKAHSVSANGEDFYRGDRILFTKNARSLGLQNGMMGTIKKLNPFLGTVTVKIDGSDQVRTVSLKNYDRVKLSYAVTTHKGQGMTVPPRFCHDQRIYAGPGAFLCSGESGQAGNQGLHHGS